VPDRAVSGLSNISDREVLLGRLQFLQAYNIRLRLLEPSQKHRQSAVDPVHVIGREFHDFGGAPGFRPLARGAIVKL
jgi:hypothetical protein